MSLGSTVNREKNGTLLAYIAEHVDNINLRKMLKLVYLIDEKFMALRGFPITWFDYYVWAKGPVAPEVYAVKQGDFSDYVTCQKNATGQYIIRSAFKHVFLLDKKMETYSPYEQKIIDDVIALYGDKSADELTAITHEDTSLWSQIVQEQHVSFVDGKSDVLIPLERLNEGQAEKESAYDGALDYMQFCNATAPC